MLGGDTGAAGGAFGSAAAGTSSFDAAAVRRERFAAGVTEAGAGAAGLGRSLGRAARCMRGKLGSDAADVDRACRYIRGKHGMVVPFGKTKQSVDRAAGVTAGGLTMRPATSLADGLLGVRGCAAAGAAGADGSASAGGGAVSVVRGSPDAGLAAALARVLQASLASHSSVQRSANDGAVCCAEAG